MCEECNYYMNADDCYGICLKDGSFVCGDYCCEEKREYEED